MNWDCLSNAQAKNSERSIEEDEIHSAIIDIHGDKARGQMASQWLFSRTVRMWSKMTFFLFSTSSLKWEL